MKIITVESLTELIRRHGFNNYMMDLVKALKRDFKNWNQFTKITRPVMHVPNGVLELMPLFVITKNITLSPVKDVPLGRRVK